MKNTVKLFLFALMVTMAFLPVSCHRHTPATVIETVYSETTSNNVDATQDPAAIPEEITRFTPLNDNERFAYSIENARDNQGQQAWWNITLYAVRNNDINDVTELFTWENIEWSNVNFTDDLKVCFFLARQRTENMHIWTSNLYKANGFTGEVRRLITDTIPLFRVSTDGRFISFIKENPDRYSANIFLFDVENEIMVGEFEWRLNRTVNSWEIFRYENIFRIFGTLMGVELIAAAELNPATMEFRTLWNNAAAEDIKDIIHVDDWRDDVSRLFRNPNIRLRIDELPL